MSRERGLVDVTWYGAKLNSPGWDDPNGRTPGVTLGAIADVDMRHENYSPRVVVVAVGVLSEIRRTWNDVTNFR